MAAIQTFILHLKTAPIGQVSHNLDLLHNQSSCKYIEDFRTSSLESSFLGTNSSEIMTPYFEKNSYQPLSSVTIASIADLGYEVDLSAADPLILFERHDATNKTNTNRSLRTTINTYGDCREYELTNVTIHCLKPTKTFRLDYGSILRPDIKIVQK